MLLVIQRSNAIGDRERDSSSLVEQKRRIKVVRKAKERREPTRLACCTLVRDGGT